MRRGDIYFAELSPTVGSEINKRRPARKMEGLDQALMQQVEAAIKLHLALA